MLAFPKPSKGSLTIERRGKRAQRRTFEQEQKAQVVKRDGAKTCRLVPGCTEREKFETAHIAAKGAGGDHGVRSTTQNMLRACLFHHQGARSLHSGDLRVEFLTDDGADGPIEVWSRYELGGWYLVKREVQCGVSERD